MSTAQSRLLHLHIEKTGGTALRFAMMKALGPGARRFPHHHESQLATIEADSWDLISGHFGYTRLAPLGGRTVVLLRDPIDRFVSVYYYWREMHERGVTRTRATRLAGVFSLEDFAGIKDDVALLEQFFHRMTWQLADTFTLNARHELHGEGITDEQLLARAILNLQACTVVGLQERMDLFAGRFKARIGPPLNIERLNVTEARIPVADISAEARRRILEWVFLDMELYQAACVLVAAEERGATRTTA